MELEKRKHLRLKEYDYSQTGYYFVTVCTKDRAKILSQIVGRGITNPPPFVGRDDPGAPNHQPPTVRLLLCGERVEHYIRKIPEAYSYVSVDKYVIMPNHVHLLLHIRGENGGAPGSSRPTQTIPRLIGVLKRLTNRDIGEKIWQTSYYDHIIRNEADYLRIWDYIDTNPAKWQEDEYYAP